MVVNSEARADPPPSHTRWPRNANWRRVSTHYMQQSKPARGLRNTFLRRTAILAMEKSVGRLCQRSSRVTFLPGDLCLKSGRSVRLTEALTMEYI